MLVVLAVINNTLKYELILSKGASFIEGHHISPATQRDLLRLTYENLLLLQIQNRVINRQVQYHGQLGRHNCCQDKNTPQEQFLLASVLILHTLIQHVPRSKQRTDQQKQYNPQPILLFNCRVLSMSHHPSDQLSLRSVKTCLKHHTDTATNQGRAWDLSGTGGAFHELGYFVLVMIIVYL